ncbi:RagB/SusD family nutrient uptake outer membrane protein [Chitinophaga silvatica]|uniref:RagB/SusD family nutrient uptake outer membrane protein n=1 Tax=Chitinophaga silvatica TaxID=2282649 RepID=A0A3E1Y8I2_9BACT|nr:RagB/SusD family nutrient uptake outer membrane protein [Chitinophaga silvatica]RFS21700.1 RagB/SusD family nutrient uptake outer membrane protein [Chitinophaga silvatica]
MKKHVLNISVALLSILLVSCNKWLEVQPQDRISEETLFSTPSGFRTALNGIYQQLAQAKLYGRELTWGMLSSMSQDYNTSKVTLEYKAATNSDFKDPNTLTPITNIWSNAYTAIANCNKLLNELDKKDEKFFLAGKSERDLIKGEAIAIRALLHLDMVRIFCVSPAKNNQDVVVPYQDTYPAHTATAMPTTEIMKKITADLKKAQELVATNDTINNIGSLSNGLSTLISGGGGSGGIFFGFRMNRLNYVAIHGLLARAYLYIGDMPNAKAEAEYVYKQFGPAGKKWWTFTPEYLTNTSSRYPKMANDIILAFYDPALIKNITSYTNASYNFQLNDVTSVFPGTERDYRRNLVSPDNTSYKWLEATMQAELVPQQNTIMPVLRMSEIYLIYSECLFREGNSTDALKILNALRNARGKSSSFTDNSDSGFYSELLMEYRREFLAEGQTIFAHKRLNKAMQIGTKRVEVDGRFTPPLPEGEY